MVSKRNAKTNQRYRLGKSESRRTTISQASGCQNIGALECQFLFDESQAARLKTTGGVENLKDAMTMKKKARRHRRRAQIQKRGAGLFFLRAIRRQNRLKFHRQASGLGQVEGVVFTGAGSFTFLVCRYRFLCFD